MENLTIIQKFAVWAIPLLFAITVHEVSHGWVANKLGDRTAFMLGRLTLNPIKHIDPIGTILLPLILIATNAGFIFGWAKPVPINPRNLKHPKRDMALVAVAGPLSNFIMALLWAIIAKLGMRIGLIPLVYMGSVGIFINLILMILNLLPIPPLDGSRVVSSLLPTKAAYLYDKIEPFGFFILILLLVFNILGVIIGPPVFFLQALIYSLFGFS